MIGNIAQHRGGSAASVASKPRKRSAVAPAAGTTDPGDSSALEVAIVGDGNLGLAVGASLAARGHNVRVWMPPGAVGQHHEIVGCTGGVEGSHQALYFSRVEPEIASAVRGAEVLVVSGRSVGYGAIAAQLAPCLSSGQTLLLPDAPLCAALQFAGELQRAGADRHINVGEMGKLFDTVGLDGDSLTFSEPRERVGVCGRTRNETRRVLAVGSKLWSGLVPASNMLERGLADVERLINPILRLFCSIGFHKAGLPAGLEASPGLVSIVGKAAEEVGSLAAALRVGFTGVEPLLRDYAGLKAGSLPQAVAELAGQLSADDKRESGVDSAETLAADIAETHVALSNLAMVARVPVAMIDSVIELASRVTYRDLRKEGRGLYQLGLVGLDVNEIVETVNS